MRRQWQDWAQLALGVWLFFSPFFLHYTDVNNAAMNAYLIGIAIAVLSVAELYVHRRWEEWVNLLLGIWLIISPWLLGYNTMRGPTQNAVVLGLIMIVLPLWAVGQQTAVRRY